MTRRRKDPFAGKENVRHFRLVQRPLGSENPEQSVLSFDEMFEEYSPNGHNANFKTEDAELEEEFDETVSDIQENDYDFVNDEDGEMVDIDAELDRFAEEFIDIEGEDGVDRIKKAVAAGEAAKYGILLDDRDYDYTKHLRQVGITPGAVFIQAPGMKKTAGTIVNEKLRDFFDTEIKVSNEPETVAFESSSPDPSLIKANHEAARQQYRALLQQVSDDPVLKEVIEALEDDRYVTEEFDDELVISMDNLNIKENELDFDEEEEDFFFDEEDVDILNENEEFPDFIPSEALKHQQKEEQNEFDNILNEYDDNFEENLDNYKDNIKYNREFVDIEGDYDDDEQGGDFELTEEAEEIYKYLKEHGRARGTTLYDKKRPDHLPPIHIAIAQYNELRRELAVNNDLILQKYSVEDEEEARRQVQESEKIIESMVKIIDDPEEMEKRLNIETAKYLLKLSETPFSAGPKKIIENVTTKVKESATISESENESESEEEAPRINKGVARSVNETAEEKKARKAKIKAEKREKRAVKSEKRK